MHITDLGRKLRGFRRAFGVGIMLASALGGYTSGLSAQNSGKTTRPKSTKTAAKPTPAVEEPVWPVQSPDPLPGAMLPSKRIVAFYGNPLSKRMGILGELPPDEMLAKLDREVAAWNAADPSTPVQPALHMIAVVASDAPGASGKYRTRMDSALIERVYGWAHQRTRSCFSTFRSGRERYRKNCRDLRNF